MFQGEVVSKSERAVSKGERAIAVAVAPLNPSGKGSKRMGRDSFVAEAAVRFERIAGTIARLERELERSRIAIDEMAEEATRNKRFQAFEVSLENSRDYKITDLQRGCKDLKARLDAIEGDRSKFAGLTYRSFEAVDRKLAELAKAQTQVERIAGAARRNEVLFLGALAFAILSFASHFMV